MSLRACFVPAAVLVCSCAGAPATIEFIDVTPAHPRLGEIATVRFRLLDYRGVAQAGTNVTFKLVSDKPGVTLSPTTAMSLKGSGEVSVQLTSTYNVQSVVVQADAGGGKVALSPPITFAGSTASANQFTFQCGPISGTASGGIHAIGAYDQSRHLIAGVKVNCTAHVADRNGDGIPNALVSFLTEAGAIGPTETSQADVDGNATVLYKTSLPLPHETDPDTFSWSPLDDDTHTGEFLVPLWMEPQSWTQNPLATLLTGFPAYNANKLDEPRRRDPVRVLPNSTQHYLNNPRDNLVTLIAVTAGEEPFIDKNNNGKFDDDEEPIDTTEPFVDSNDNGTYDEDEKYIDTDGNGHWDGKNGKWDANTLIWRQERILWTGAPFGSLYAHTGTGMGQTDDYTAPEPVIRGSQPLMPPLIGCHGAVGLEFLVADPWFNSLAQNSDSDGCENAGSSKNVDVAGGRKGIAFTYPPLRRIDFEVVDNLKRDPDPMTNPPDPSCYPANHPTHPSVPQPWDVLIRCSFTASPQSGHVIVLFDEATGTVVNNHPDQR